MKVIIALSDEPTQKATNTYVCIWGGWSNTITAVRAGRQGKIIAQDKTAAGAGIPAPELWNTFFVVIDEAAGSLRLGMGTDPAQGVILEYTVPRKADFFKNLRFFSFSSWGSHVQYSDVQVSSRPFRRGSKAEGSTDGHNLALPPPAQIYGRWSGAYSCQGQVTRLNLTLARPRARSHSGAEEVVQGTFGFRTNIESFVQQEALREKLTSTELPSLKVVFPDGFADAPLGYDEALEDSSSIPTLPVHRSNILAARLRIASPTDGCGVDALRVPDGHTRSYYQGAVVLLEQGACSKASVVQLVWKAGGVGVFFTREGAAPLSKMGLPTKNEHNVANAGGPDVVEGGAASEGQTPLPSTANLPVISLHADATDTLMRAIHASSGHVKVTLATASDDAATGPGVSHGLLGAAQLRQLQGSVMRQIMMAVQQQQELQQEGGAALGAQDGQVSLIFADGTQTMQLGFDRLAEVLQDFEDSAQSAGDRPTQEIGTGEHGRASTTGHRDRASGGAAAARANRQANHARSKQQAAQKASTPNSQAAQSRTESGSTLATVSVRTTGKQSQRYECKFQALANTWIEYRPGMDLASVAGLKTEKSCQEACCRNQDCEHYSFDKEYNTCFLRANKKGVKSQSSNRFDSGILRYKSKS